jgi:hypothetical protein
MVVKMRISDTSVWECVFVCVYKGEFENVVVGCIKESNKSNHQSNSVYSQSHENNKLHVRFDVFT